jgi:hypothetical protein
MALHPRFVDEIHGRLLVRYGSKWINLWAGVPEQAIKADWSEQLATVTPAGVRFALDNLPDEYPPTVGQFRALCLTQQRPELQAPALPAPSRDGLKRIAKELQGARISRETPAQFMERLRRDVEGGKASQARIDHYRIAAANGHYGGTTVEQLGDFRPIPNDSLPPGMRQREDYPEYEGFDA